MDLLLNRKVLWHGLCYQIGRSTESSWPIKMPQNKRLPWNIIAGVREKMTEARLSLHGTGHGTLT